ncbi:MAG: hypothetical protein ACREP8_05155, partial [Candidatus Binatia bacterium]
PKSEKLRTSDVPQKKDLLAEAMDAYGIRIEHIWSLHRVNETAITGKRFVSITTKGGVRIDFSRGDKGRALSEAELKGPWDRFRAGP